MTKRLLSTQKIVNLSTDPGSGVAGEMYFNTTTNVLRFHNGTIWVDFGSGSGGGVTVSTTAPSSPSEGDLWLNSNNLIMYAYYDSYWVEFNTATVASPVSTDVALSNSWWMGV